MCDSVKQGCSAQCRCFIISSENQDTEVLQKDLEPKENKDQAADKLSFALVSASEEVSNNNSGDGDDHGCDPDDGDRFYDRSSEESKCDSDSECVNTGCDSENKHVFVVDRCVHEIGRASCRERV